MAPRKAAMMPLLVKLALLGCCAASRVQQRDWPLREEEKALDLVGMPPEAIDGNNGVYSLLQADVALLKRLKRLDSKLFEELMPNAVVGGYTDAAVGGKVGKGGLMALFSVLGGYAGNAATAMWAWDLAADAETSRRDVLSYGEDAKLKYVAAATFGNLWQSLAAVNAFQFAPRREGIAVLDAGHAAMESYVLPQHAVLTPRRPPNASNYSLLEVSWPEQQRMRSGWVRLEDVTSSAFLATRPLQVYSLPVDAAEVVTTLEEGETFTVSRHLQSKGEDGEKHRWLALANGRGFLHRDDGGLVGPLDEELHWEKPEGREALRRLYKAHTHWATELGRVGLSVAMFTAGYFTAGAAWGLSAAVDTADSLQGAALEGLALSDLDLKMNYLMSKLREWELAIVTNASRRCHAAWQKCPGEMRCVREWAFVELEAQNTGLGWCAESERRQVGDGEFCLVHADCRSAHCAWPKGCKGAACFQRGRCEEWRATG